MMSVTKVWALTAVLALVPLAAEAQWEVEADPIAYGLSGYSVHLARLVLDGRARVQVGAYGVEVPERLHGNDGFTERQRGVTMKGDYFLRRHPSGLFVGLDGFLSRARYRLDATDQRVQRTLVGLGPRVGYRFNVGERLHITPWVSMSYLINAGDVTISGERFESGRYAIFPTVHLGWRF